MSSSQRFAEGAGPPASRSKVEIGPAEARFYDLLMDAISLGHYRHLIKRVVDKMAVQAGESVLDLGSGTGRNDCLIARKTGSEGRILGLDISRQMLTSSRKRCQPHPNVAFREQRIEMPLALEEEFDKVFISFVLHGFEDTGKLGIIENAYRALKPGGVFCIFDYNQFDLDRLWFPFRWAFVHGECQLASEFLRLDLKQMLLSQGFVSFEEELFAAGHLRLLMAAK